MENFHLQASAPADRKPNLAPPLPLIAEQKPSSFAFHSLVIPSIHADPISTVSVRHRLLARHFVGQSGY
jgi:hypothetical protein